MARRKNENVLEAKKVLASLNDLYWDSSDIDELERVRKVMFKIHEQCAWYLCCISMSMGTTTEWDRAQREKAFKANKEKPNTETEPPALAIA